MFAWLFVRLVLDASCTLWLWQTWKKLPFRFSLLVTELEKADLTTYRTAVMALINSIIVANENIRDRVRMRNEFIGKLQEETCLDTKGRCWSV